jgi:hypothetical protein
MSEVGTVDVRIRYLEQLSKQLAEQIKVMKQLVTTEVTDLKAVMQSQVAEIKQIVMHQDRVYQERIRRLEARVEQLSEFQMHLARSGASTGVMPLPHELSAAPPADERTPSPRGGGGDDDDEEQGDATLDGVAAKYKDKIHTIYDYYTRSNIQVFHPAMTLAHFTKFCKDCNMATFGDGNTPVELMWMTILRKLGRRRRMRKQPKGTTLISKYNKPKETGFAFERLDDIPKDYFPQALAIMALEKVGKQRPDLTPEHIFEHFLIVEIFPHTDPRVVGTRNLNELAEHAGSASIQEYKSDAVKEAMKPYLSRLREGFYEAVKSAQRYSDTDMTLDGFVEFVKRHNLLPLIAKPDIRQIFLACSAIEASRNKEAKPDTISCKGSFNLTIYHLADRIYGDRLYADKYPTPESRVQKLLAKMFLLS